MKENEHKKSGVYGVIGAIALILIGGIFGFIINGTTRINHSNMSKGDCGEIANRILSAARNNQPQLIEQLNKVYSENCLDREFEQPKPEPKSEEKKMPETTCGQIEMLLLDRLMPNNSQDPEDHIDNAKIYANLSERGCPENSLKYRDLAAKELEIARALNDDNVADDPDESIEIVETYKRLQMQQEAARMIEKAKKLTNPAIDFIIELEKIIEE